MAKNKIQIDVMVNGKMEKATVSTKKLKKALDGAKASQDQLNTSTRQGYRAAQGAAQNTANSTKAFSKQAGVVGGLVPIYATFAANVFAIGAAFGVLSRNAAIKQLETSLTNTGIAAGKNLPGIADNLKAITGEAISTEAALRATAIATSSNFSTQQLQELTKVATGASIALGRNLPDALDRLVRGTAKLEPEILDELGIIVRLDQATRDYAVKLNKTAGELTQFERQQAFLNATITQGIDKYGKIAQTIDPNPYDRLSSAFDDLVKNSLELVNKGLIPVVEFLSESPTALFSALGLFGTTIVSQIVPAVSQLSAASAASFAQAARAAKISAMAIQSEYSIAAQKIQTLDFLPKGFKALAPSIKSGKAQLTDYKKAVTSLKIAEGRRIAEIKKTEVAIKSLSGFQKQASQQFLATKKAELAAIQEQKAAVLELQAIAARGAVVGTGAVGAAGQKANRDKRRAVGARVEKKTLDKIDKGSAIGSIGTAAGGIALLLSNIKRTEGAIPKFAESMKSLGSAGKFLTAVFNRLLGPLSLALGAFSLLTFIFPDLFNFFGGVETKVDKAAKSFDKTTAIIAAFKKEMQTITNPITKAVRELEVMSGIVDTTAGAFGQLQDATEKEQSKSLKEALDAQLEAQRDFDAKQEKVDARREGRERGSLVRRVRLRNQAAKALEAAQMKVNMAMEQYGQVNQTEAKDLFTRNYAELQASGAFKEMPELLMVYEKFNRIIKSGGNLDITQFNKELQAATEPQRRLASGIEAATQALNTFDAESAKLGSKQLTPFSPAIRAAKQFSIEADSAIQEVAKKLSNVYRLEGNFSAPLQSKRVKVPVELSTIGLDDLEAEFPGVIKQAEFLKDKLGDAFKGPIEDAQQLTDAQAQYNEILEKSEDRLIQAKAIQMEQETILKRINKLASTGAGFASIQIAQELQVRKEKIKTLNAQKTLTSLILQDESAEKQRIADIDAQIAALGTDQEDAARNKYRLEQDNINLAKEALSIEQKKLDIIKRQNDVLTRQEDRQLRANARERNKSRTGRFFEDRRALEDQIKTEKARLERNKTFLKAEADQKKLNVAIEYALLDAKYAYLAAEAQQLADELRTPARDEKGNLKPISEEAETRAKALDKSIGVYNKLKKALGAENLEIIVGADGTIQKFANVEGGILGGLFGAINSETQEGVKDLTENITELEQKLKDLEPVSVALDAAFDTLSQGLGDAFNQVIDGAKSAKEAIADLATSILQSFRKVLADELANRFLEFVGSKISLPSLGGSKKFDEVNTVNPAYLTNQDATANPLGNLTMDPSMGKPAPGALATGTSMDAGMAGLDGMGLGASPAKPVYVTMVENPLGGGIASAEAAATTGAVGGDLGGLAEDPATKATKENTEATKKLNLNTASAVTAGLATVAALTGNEKAAAALALVTAALQLAQLFQSTVTTADTAATAASTVAITTALAANTFAIAANTQMLAISTFGFRTGGISTPSGPMKGYSTGGISKGAQGGYPVMLHGTEAVVPLPNGKSIPVEMSGSAGGMQQNNVSVNVVMNQDGSTDTQTDGQDAENLGKRISLLVQKELVNQKRVGGMLSGIGAV
jgi:hypothetical protein